VLRVSRETLNISVQIVVRNYHSVDGGDHTISCARARAPASESESSSPG
jgi:hypothetical protein